MCASMTPRTWAGGRDVTQLGTPSPHTKLWPLNAPLPWTSAAWEIKSHSPKSKLPAEGSVCANLHPFSHVACVGVVGGMSESVCLSAAIPR